MADLEAQDLLDRAQRIGLISRDHVKEVLSDAEDGSLKSVERSLSRKGLLTSWQLDKLRKGEATGFQYGRNRVLFHIAEGTFARVYRGISEGGTPIAIKVLRNRFVADRAAVDRFHKEAEAGMRLSHPNIVRIFDFGESDNRHFMVMEFVEGSNLRDFLKRRAHLPAFEALPLMLGLGRGLKYSQEQGVTHRDIKATNILISSNQQAKLVDFGLATIEELGSVNVRTVDYSALERNCGSPKGDPRSDIYFLGCVFYQMLTGLAPMPEVESGDPLVKMLRRSFGAIKPLRDQRHGNEVPEDLAEIVERMMKVDLRQRYQSMAEVVHELEAYEARLGGDALKSSPSPSDDQEAVSKDLGALASQELDYRSIFVNPPAFESKSPTKPVQDDDVLPTAEPEDEGSAHSDPEGDSGEIRALGPEMTGGEISAFVQRKVLCVEAQEVIREVFRKQFEKHGYRVLLFSDSEQALDRYKAMTIDLVVFDADGLPSGALEDFREIQKIAASKKRNLHALILLGPKQRALAKSLEGDGNIVLSKPVKLREINEAMEKLVAMQKG